MTSPGDRCPRKAKTLPCIFVPENSPRVVHVYYAAAAAAAARASVRRARWRRVCALNIAVLLSAFYVL